MDAEWEPVNRLLAHPIYQAGLRHLSKSTERECTLDGHYNPTTKSHRIVKSTGDTVSAERAFPSEEAYVLIGAHNHPTGNAAPSLMRPMEPSDLFATWTIYKENRKTGHEWSPIELIIASGEGPRRDVLAYRQRPETERLALFTLAPHQEELLQLPTSLVARFLEESGLYVATALTLDARGVLDGDLTTLTL